MIYLAMGFFVLRKGYRIRLNRLFSYICLAFAVWSLGNAFIYPSSNDADIWFWYLFSGFGWCLFPAIGFNLFFELARVDFVLKRKWISRVVYIPGLVFLFQLLTNHLYTIGFDYQGIATSEIKDVTSPWFWCYLSYAVVFMLVSLSAVLAWGIRTKKVHENRQAVTIFIAVLVSALVGFIFNMVIPILSKGKSGMPDIAPLFGLIWVGGFGWAVSRYQLMEITPEIAVEEIITNIIDTVFLINMDGSVRETNRSAEALLGYTGEEMKIKYFWELFSDRQSARSKMDEVQKHGMSQWEDRLKPRRGKLIPVNCRISCVKERIGSSIGMILIAQDLRLVKRLEKEIRKIEIVEKKLQKANENLEKKVAERTRELEMYATTDTMTGVYNRRIGFSLLEEEILKAKRNQSLLTVCFIDINDLKGVNDNFGHKEGDDLILSVVSILKENLRESDIVCRMGGDEFLVIMSNCGMNQSLEVWELIQKKIDEKNSRKLKSYSVSISRGFAEYNPIYPMTLDELITTADFQMYQYKKKSKKAAEGN